MRTLALALSTTLVTTACVSPASDQHDHCFAPPPMQLRFSTKISTKLFINNIAQPGQCGVGAVIGFGPLAAPKLIPYLAFCNATSLGENPPTEANAVPLDARILGVATVSWDCIANNPAPQNLAIAGGGSAGGDEGPGIVGVAHPMRVIARNGNQFGMVTSGRPNPLAEPAFQFFRPRLRPDIWNKITGTITCGTDANGRPTSRSNLALQSTRFPSHKVWSRSPAGGPGPSALRFNVAQGSLSSLWFLPPVPPP